MMMFQVVFVALFGFAVITCEDFEPTVEQLEAVWMFMPDGSSEKPDFAAKLAAMTREEKNTMHEYVKEVLLEGREGPTSTYTDDQRAKLKELAAVMLPGAEDLFDSKNSINDEEADRLMHLLGFMVPSE
uniref:U36-Deinotoxin-Dsu1a_1 n=1 Tax=Deinopis subrufa TaxID=1905329 RepID=A0A4Q8KDV8_DEISU